jgi:catechol 2,3-dioxygenase-like lactoylglutathione lyase family enzyme
MRGMHRILTSIAALFAFVALSAPASAQLTAARSAPVAYGHHHLNVTSIAEHKKFFVDTLGGVPITVAGREIVKFPNVLVILRQQPPTGGTKGTSMNHIGFSVPDLRKTIDTLKSRGYRMVTKEEAPSVWTVKDDIGTMEGRPVRIAFVMGPDELKVEIVEVKDQATPIALHHVHFASPQNDDQQAWYVKVFGAKPGAPGGLFPTASLPGVALNFSPSPTPVVGTPGRTVDHIGFEIKNLAEFLKKVEGMGIKPVNVREVPDLGISIGFITDPWGTYIELTEGFDKIQ